MCSRKHRVCLATVFFVLQNKKKHVWQPENRKLISNIKNGKYSISRVHLLVVFKLFYEIIIQKWRMINNKTLNIKVIFKSYLKT